MTIPNKTIWIYWHHGWDNAPEIPQVCLNSWKSKNPDWNIITLSKDTLSTYLDIENLLPNMSTKTITLASLSDLIRIFLLEKYGGVWVDSTLLCRTPLNNWLTYFENDEFFAFSKPSEDRLVASWFIFAKKNNYIIKEWHKKAIDYWANRTSTDDYFWFHSLFNSLCAENPKFKGLWDVVAKVSAHAPHFFVPYTEKFFEKSTLENLTYIKKIQAPVFKLTHKYDLTKNKEGTLLSYLLTTEMEIKKPKILIAWYGSFDKNGTIGDYLSVNTLTTFLEKNNYDFDCASYKKFEGLKGNYLSLEEAVPNNYEIVIFCCGPILKNHKNLTSFFEKFNNQYKIGIGVSLFPKNHFNYYNPFDFVLARENGEEAFEDIAVLASQASSSSNPKSDGPKIGIILRNEQHEYGKENCKSDKANDYLYALANSIIDNKSNDFISKFKNLFSTKKAAPTARQGSIIEINNHLAHSEKTTHEIEFQYSQCDLILTTRFHGSILALKNNIPLIAIDQIKDGAKVYKLVSKTGYPFVWKINRVRTRTLEKVASELLAHQHDDKLINALEKSKTNAMATLNQLHGHLLSHLKFNN